LESGTVALELALGVNGIDCREGVSPVRKVNQTTESRLVVAEEDECRKDDNEKLGKGQGTASQAEQEFWHGDWIFFLERKDRQGKLTQ